MTAWHLVAPGAIDEGMVSLVARKATVIDAVTDGTTDRDTAGSESPLGAVLVRLAEQGMPKGGDQRAR